MKRDGGGDGLLVSGVVSQIWFFFFLNYKKTACDGNSIWVLLIYIVYLSYLNNEQVTGDAKRDERMEGREIFYFFNRTCNEILALYDYIWCVFHFFFFEAFVELSIPAYCKKFIELFVAAVLQMRKLWTKLDFWYIWSLLGIPLKSGLGRTILSNILNIKECPIKKD